MKGEKFYEMLDMLDDSLVLESAEVKRRTWGWRLTVIGIIVAGLVGLWLISTYPVRHPTESLSGEMGVVQDGAYYAYAGSGFVLPGHQSVPQGIYRYVPGQGRELLVSVKDHPMNVIFSSWGVNSHSLYYIDSGTSELYRMDLATREESLLFSAGGETASAAEEKLDPSQEDVWSTLKDVLTGKRPVEELEEELDVEEKYTQLLVKNVGEDAVSVSCFSGTENDIITLDSKTGEVLSQEPFGTDALITVGDRTFHQVQMEYPEGVTYPGWEQDKEYGLYFWYDLQENGKSILPQGTKLADGFGGQLGDGCLVAYTARPPYDEGETSSVENYLFLAETGEILSVPNEIGGEYPTYVASAKGWLYYTSSDYDNPDPAKRATYLGAWNLETGENRILEPQFRQTSVVTDGTWLYTGGGQRTNCYTIDHDAQGKPCGLTLVEEDI